MSNKFFVLAFTLYLLFAGNSTSAFSLGIENPVYPIVKKEIEKQASAALGREVRIGSVSGNLITSVTLNDVVVAKDKKISGGKIISIKRAQVSYNALRGVLAKDMLQSLTSIHLESPDVYIEHEYDGSWNYEKLIPPGGPGDAAPPVFRARISVSDGRALFVDKKGFGAPIKDKFEQSLRRIKGTANFSRKDRLLFRFSAFTQEGPVKVDGSVNLMDLKTDVKVTATDLDLKKWNDYLGIPFAKDIPMAGTADLELFVSTLPDLKLKTTVFLKNGLIYDRPAKGEISILLDEKEFSISLAKAVFCSGGVSGSFAADLSGKTSGMSGKFILSKTDMSALALQTPGIVGRADGSIVIKGNGAGLAVSGDLDFDGGMLLGQKIEHLSSVAAVKNGDINIDSVRLYSGKRELAVSGHIKRDASFAFDTKIRGFVFRNSDVFGGVHGLIESFDGRVSGKLDDKTFKHPLKNIEAEGLLLLSRGRIGSQRISRAQGRVRLSNGVFESEGFSVVLESSGFLLSGNVGINRQSDFKIVGRNLDLSDLKIIDDILPESAKGVSGTGNLNVSVGGYLSESQNIAEAVKTLDISVEADVQGASLGVRNIKTARLSALWKNNSLSLNELYFETPDSRFYAFGKMDGNGNLSGSFDGNIFISDFSPFVQRYAKVLGRLSFEGTLKGTASAPDIAAAFIASGINYNNIQFDSLSGTARYKNATFYLDSPSALTYGKDKYSIYGRLSFDSLGPVYSGGVYTDKGNLDSLSSIAKMVYKEFGRRTNIYDATGTSSIVFPDIKKYKSSDGDYLLLTPDNGFLKKWEQASRKATEEQKDESIITTLLEMNAKAPLGLKAEFSGNSRGVTGSASFISSKGKISSYDFDSIYGTVVLDKNSLTMKDLTIKKSSGWLSVSGRVDFSGPLNISVRSKDFNVKGIDKSVNLDIPVEGKLDIDAAVTGTYLDPKIDCVLSGTDSGVGEISIDRLDADLSYAKGQLFIRKMSLQADQQVASMEGVIPFVKGKELSLSLDLSGDNIGLLASLVKGVRWDSGTGAARLRASGTLDNPKINGVLSLKKATVNIDQIKTTLYGFDADLSFDDSRVSVKKFSGILSGGRTGGKPLPFSLTGSIDFSETFGEKKKTEVDLAVADTSGYIDIPGIYSGGFSLSTCRLKGPFVLPGVKDASGNMLVKAALVLKDGSIILPGGGGTENPKPNIEFDVSAAIGKNMRLIQGSSDRVLSMDVANIDLQIFGEELLISGTMAAPVIKGDVEIKSGSLTILGREFDVLNEYEQEKYFGSDRSSIIRNEAVFQGGKTYSAIPYIRLTAKSEILSYFRSKAETYPDGSTSSPVIQKDTTIIITRISGMPFVTERSRIMEPHFYAFKLDTSRSPAEPVPASYDDNQIRIMLLPDFLKSSLGVSEGDVQEGLDANAIMVDYLNARLQSVIFRRLTSRVEDALGLESFTLDYNFGRDLEKLLPTRRGAYGVNDTPQFGVGFVKGIFNNVFIQVRYAQALEQSSYINNMSLNYQITWKITRVYSLVYYREPITFQAQDSTYYKMTLQSQYSF